MKLKMFNWLREHLYLVWGACVVGGVTVLTGSMVGSVLGYMVAVGFLFMFRVSK